MWEGDNNSDNPFKFFGLKTIILSALCVIPAWAIYTAGVILLG